MEVIEEAPPPLPTKSKKMTEVTGEPRATDRTGFWLGQVNARRSNGLRNNSRSLEIDEEIRVYANGSFERKTEQEVDARESTERAMIKTFDETGKNRRDEAFGTKIITWAESKKNDQEQLYENVVKGGNGRQEEEGTKREAKSSKSGYKKLIQGRKRTPKIEVRQEEHKTVVRISIKDNPSPEEEGSAEDPFERPKNVYENGYREANGFAPIYANCEKLDGGLYENVIGFSEEKDGEYANVCVDNEYANVSIQMSSRKEPQSSERSISRCENARENDVSQFGGNAENSTSSRIHRPELNERSDELYENIKGECRTYENIHREDDAEGKCESKTRRRGCKDSKSPEKGKPEEGEYEDLGHADEHPSAEGAFDSGTSSDVDTLPLVRREKGNVVVTIKAVSGEEIKSGHVRAESLASSGLGVDSEDEDDDKSNISSDSLNSNERYPQSEDNGYHTTEDKTGSPTEYENVMKTAEKPALEGETIQKTTNPSEMTKDGEDDGVYVARLMQYPEFDEYENVRIFNGKVFKKKPAPPPPTSGLPNISEEDKKSLPVNLLRDIRSRSARLSSTYPSGEEPPKRTDCRKRRQISNASKTGVVEERTYDERKTESVKKLNGIRAMEVDTDKFYKFHLFENIGNEANGNEEETFAGVKDFLSRDKSAAITSAKGTIRGVRNRVKAGIATFLQLHENKSYKDKDSGKVVVYTTTMGIVRETYQKCLKVKQILKTLMVKFEERDVFMSAEAQDDIRERMKTNLILVPQVFVEGQHIGDAETIERLNEMGELRTILKPYKSPDACSTCKVCGGYRLLPCSVCKGSKKSIHRNHFTAEFVSLKCMNCDQVGLTKCHAC